MSALSAKLTTKPWPLDILAAGVVQRMAKIPVREVSKSEATLIHSAAHWDKVRATACESSGDMTGLNY